MRLLLIASLLLAPSASAEGPEFDAAAIKPFSPAGDNMLRVGTRGGPGTADPTHISVVGTSIGGLLRTAFGLEQYQIIATIPNDLWEFALVVPEGATKEQVPVMWRNLLISRFGMKFHTEQREMPVEDLVVGPRGHKLAIAAPLPTDADGSESAEPALSFDKDGTPIRQKPGITTIGRMTAQGLAIRMVARAQSMEEVVKAFSVQLRHPVIDKTGLLGRYDFLLDYAPAAAMRAGEGAPAGQNAGAAPTPELGLEFSEAVQQQLGVRLVKSKGSIPVVVIDAINKVPTDN